MILLLFFLAFISVIIGTVEMYVILAVFCVFVIRERSEWCVTGVLTENTVTFNTIALLWRHSIAEDNHLCEMFLFKVFLSFLVIQINKM